MIVSNTGLSASGYVTSGASAPSSPAQKMSDLFDQIDTSGSGSITKAQFEQAFQQLNPPPSFQAAGADTIWNKLDPNGTGSVSKQDFVGTMSGLMKQLRGHHHHHSSSAGAATVTQNADLLSLLGNANGVSSSDAATGTTALTDGSSTGLLLDVLA